MATRSHAGRRRIAARHIPELRREGQELRSLEAEQLRIERLMLQGCALRDVHVGAVEIRRGYARSCKLSHCELREVSATVAVENCQIHRSELVGLTGASFDWCRFYRCTILGAAGLRFHGCEFERCVLEAGLEEREDCTFVDCTVVDLEARGGEASSELPWEEGRGWDPPYMSAGEIMGSRRREVRPGFLKATLRDLRRAHQQLPRGDETFYLRFLARLRTSTLGMSSAHARTLRLLVSVDRDRKGLLWPSVDWLAKRTKLAKQEQEQVLEELLRKGWLDKRIREGVHAVFIDYDRLRKRLGG